MKCHNNEVKVQMHTSNMNKYYRKHFFVLMIIWLISLFSLSIFSYYKFSSDLKNELGNQAMLIAIDIAERLSIEEKEIDRLLSLDFNQLLKDNINIEFEKKARAVMNYSNIKYIYFVSPIDDSRVKYVVEEGEEGIYSSPAGTPLNIVYLLDAVESQETRLKDTNGSWYVDKDRYTVRTERLKKAITYDRPSYYINADQWGSYITGYAHVYTEDGKDLGLIGVDIILDKYQASIKKYLIIISGFVFTNIGIGIFAIILIFAVKKSEEQIYEKTVLSCTDELTSILNRRGFIELLEEELQKSIKDKRQISLLLLDVDYFKEFNDAYGHLAGDDALRKIATLLKEKANEYEGFAGRYGGDEFAILLPDIDREKAEEVANTIVNEIGELYKVESSQRGIPFNTVSIGVTSFVPEEEVTIQTLIDYADTALYKSKRYGRNRAYVLEKSPLCSTKE